MELANLKSVDLVAFSLRSSDNSWPKMLHRPERNKLFTSKSDLNTISLVHEGRPHFLKQINCFIRIKPDTVVLPKLFTL